MTAGVSVSLTNFIFKDGHGANTNHKMPDAVSEAVTAGGGEPAAKRAKTDTAAAPPKKEDLKPL